MHARYHSSELQSLDTLYAEGFLFSSSGYQIGKKINSFV